MPCCHWQHGNTNDSDISSSFILFFCECRPLTSPFQLLMTFRCHIAMGNMATRHSSSSLDHSLSPNKDYTNAHHCHATTAMTTTCHHHHLKSATGHDDHPPPPPCNSAHNRPPHHSKPATATTAIHHHYPAMMPTTAHHHSTPPAPCKTPKPNKAVWKPTCCLFLILRVPEHNEVVGFPPTVSFLHMYLQSP